MRRAYKENNDAVLAIQPIADVIPVPIPSPQKINYKQEEVFDKKVTVEEEKEEEEPKEEEPKEEKPVALEIKEKRRVGQRGKDKKARVKRDKVSERQLAHLAMCRAKSKEKREAKKLEKARLKKEENEKVDAKPVIQMEKEKETKKRRAFRNNGIREVFFVDGKV